MPATLIRLLTLLAFVAMPFGMSHAPAEAHAMPAAMDGHCNEHSDTQIPPAGDMAQCMLMCAALPAAEPLNVAPPAMPSAPRQQTMSKVIRGIILEIATPPPRSA